MRCIVLHHETDLTHFRDTIRPLLAARVPIRELGFRVGYEPTDLFSGESDSDLFFVKDRPQYPVRLTRGQLALCERVLCHRAPERLWHLYNLLLAWQTRPEALDDPLCASAKWVREADQAVRRDRHKMHAFVRFKKIGEIEVEADLEADLETGKKTEKREQFCAWFEPDHRIVALTADFFRRRFTGMNWSILTPDGCSHWDGQNLSLTPGVDKSHAPDRDATEAAWKTYYSSIFNPSRVKIGAMLSEMPKKYWKNLPEAEIIPQLIQQAEDRQRGFMRTAETTPNIRTEKVAPEVFAASATPQKLTTLSDARDAAQRCTQCDLHHCATQVVWGDGPADAQVMLVGEQPGDREDIAGRPFVGPAGQLLDQALKEAGLNRDGLYVTNAVKHFKFETHGTQRLHRTPIADEIERCKSWLDLERRLVRPRVILAMGKTAVRSVTGHKGPLKSVRATVMTGEYGEKVLATVHPSFLLRLPDPNIREQEYARFVADLSRAKTLISKSLVPKERLSA